MARSRLLRPYSRPKARRCITIASVANNISNTGLTALTQSATNTEPLSGKPRQPTSPGRPLIWKTRSVFLPLRSFGTSSSYLNMASDEDYLSFLDKANQDPNAGHAKSASKQEFKTTDSGAQVPAVLKSAVKDVFYVSDADEPFVPVCLNWDEGGRGLPDEGMYISLASVSPDARVR